MSACASAVQRVHYDRSMHCSRTRAPCYQHHTGHAAAPLPQGPVTPTSPTDPHSHSVVHPLRSRQYYRHVAQMSGHEYIVLPAAGLDARTLSAALHRLAVARHRTGAGRPGRALQEPLSWITPASFERDAHTLGTYLLHALSVHDPTLAPWPH